MNSTILVLIVLMLAHSTKGEVDQQADAAQILKLITLNDTFGLYYTTLSVGTPSTPISVSIDTGSELNWLKCLPCLDCGDTMSNSRLFMPYKSSTFNVIECITNQSCPQTSSGRGTSCAASATPHICIYEYSYDDNSTTTGYLFRDTLTIEGTPSSAAAAGAAANSNSTQTPSTYKNHSHEGVAFGCGILNTGVEATNNGSGILGLSRGPLSLVSQLGITKFSYCLPQRGHSTNVSGYLILGDHGTHPTLPMELQYTTMQPPINVTGSATQMYYMGVLGISINGMLLDIPASAFPISSDGLSGGMYLDSGTSFTTLVREAYTIFQAEFVAAMDPSLMIVSNGNGRRICYAVPPSQTGTLVAPRVTFHFADSLDVHLTTDHSLWVDQVASDAVHDVYCLGYDEAGSVLIPGAQNVFGNHQQQAFHIEFDIGASRIGFASSSNNCHL